jgi:ATP-dependent DNA helicase DinG
VARGASGPTARNRNLGAVDDVFGPGGALSATLSGYEPRPEQEALAESVACALDTRTHLLAEAGTGVGKSLAYLIPAVESGRRVVVATATKALQEQLLVHDVPAAEAALGRELRVAVLKGRQNYLCRKSLQGLGLLGGALLKSEEDAALYERMLPWIDATETGDRAELEVEPPAPLWNELAVGSDRCAGRRCAFFSTCFAEAARDRAGEAELVIANHALYFADVGLRGKSDGAAVLPDHDAVVFDEAHRLEESAATWLGGRVSAGGLNRLASDVERACREASIAVPARALDGVVIAGDRLFSAVAPPSGRLRLREPPPDLVLELAGALARLAEALAGRGEDLDGLARRAAGLAIELELCLDEAPDLERVVWAEPGAMAWAPVDVSQLLRELLWGAGPTAVLVSATLGLDGSFAFPRARLGIDEADELAVGSPFDFREQALLYLPRSLPDPRSPEALARIAEEVVSLCGLSRGRALVLTTSYRALGEIATRIRGRLPYPVLVQGEAPRERLLERFRSEVDSVLVATSTFWQGVDIPGEALSLLVIAKLPFAAPGDPLHEARCERIVRDGGDWFQDYALPTAVLQLRQGFGRLIRGHADRGVVAVLDPRLSTRGYGRAFLDSLPPARVARDRAEVAAFFDSHAVGAAVGGC